MKIIENLKFYKKELIIGPILKLFEAMIELSLPFLISKMLDQNFTSPWLTWILCLMLVLVVIGVCFASISQYMAARASQGFGTKMRNDIYMHILKLNQEQVEKLSPTFLINTVTNDVIQLEIALAMFIRLVIRVPFICIGALVMVFIINKKLALILFLSTCVLGFVIHILVKYVAPLYKKAKKKLDELANIVKENLINIRVVRGFVQEIQEIEKFKVKNNETAKYIEISNIASNLLNPITTFILNITIVIILYFSSIQIQTGNLKQGELIAVINYISQMLLAVVVLANLITIYTKSYTSFIRVNKIMNVKLERQEGNVNKINENKIAIKLKNVDFSYHDKKVLKNINIEIEKGKIIGIIGLTGSGKSTLLNLICRNYDVDKGEIYIFENDIKKYNLEYLKQEVVFLSQRPNFFHDSIKENILLGRENIEDFEIQEAIEKSKSLEFIEKLPEGIKTNLNDNAGNLSGGQKQRIAIARGFIGNKKILLLDDITSALDSKTEKDVLNNIILYARENEITVLIATQKIKVLNYTDKIIVINKGKVESYATKENLKKNSKTYREIYNLQENK